MAATNHTSNYDLSQTELDPMYKAANGIVRVGHAA